MLPEPQSAPAASPGRAPERSRAIPPSALHSVHRLVESRGDGIIALHIGEAHLGIPQAAKDAFCEAIRDNRSTYCDAPGLISLREALCQKVGEKTGAPPPVEHMFVTPGSCQGISAILLSLASEGGVALLPEIHWPMHLQQVVMAGLKPRFYSMTDPDLGVRGSLEANYDPNVCVVIVNSPSNPAGQVLSEDEVSEIYGWARERGVWVISDEAYEDFAFEGSRSVMGALDAAEKPGDRIVYGVRTFSKTYCMTGYRLGYVTAPNDDRAGLLLKVQEASLVAPCAPVQFAGLAALGDVSHVQAHHDYVKGTRDRILPMLLEQGLVWIRPEGGWYMLLDLSAFTDDVEAFCSRMLDEAGVAVAPGRSFAPAGHPAASKLVRLAFCREREYTVQGVQRLLGYLARSNRG